MTDTGVQIEGDEITVGLAANAVHATGEVSSVMQPAATRERQRPGPHAGAARRRPGGVRQRRGARIRQPGSAAAPTPAGPGSGRATPTIRAERIVLDEARGDLAASGGVQSTLAIGQRGDRRRTPAAPGARSPGPRTMRYDDAARTATYTTGRADERPAGRSGRPTASRWCWPPRRRTLERIEGYGSVVARVEGRDARGARLTHLTSDGRYVFTGTPVQFTEDCRVTTGRTLTFFGIGR